MTGSLHERVLCSTCKLDCSDHHFLCDEVEGEWCPSCFELTPCGKGLHDEGCLTGVFGLREEDPQ